MDMDSYYPYNSIGSDRMHDADDLARLMKALLTNGVAMKDATNLQVVAAGDFNVTVKTGSCINEGRVGVNESEKAFTIAAPYAGADRIDRIVSRADYANRKSTLIYLQGTPASSPEAPALKDDVDGHDIPLARISVASGTAAINQGMITDERITSGLVVPGNLEAWLTQVQTALQETSSAMTTSLGAWITGKQTDFNTWFAGVQSALAGDTAGNLLNLINTYKAKPHVVTLETEGWGGTGPYTLTINSDDVTADNIVIAGPDPTNKTAWEDSGVYLSAQDTGALTFTAESVPEENISANVIILNA